MSTRLYEENTLDKLDLAYRKFREEHGPIGHSEGYEDALGYIEAGPKGDDVLYPHELQYELPFDGHANVFDRGLQAAGYDLNTPTDKLMADTGLGITVGGCLNGHGFADT